VDFEELKNLKNRIESTIPVNRQPSDLDRQNRKNIRAAHKLNGREMKADLNQHVEKLRQKLEAIQDLSSLVEDEIQEATQKIDRLRRGGQRPTISRPNTATSVVTLDSQDFSVPSTPPSTP
jgi:hypothetical protein